MPVEVTIEVRNAKLIRKGLQDLKREVPRIGRQDVYHSLWLVKKQVDKPIAPRDPDVLFEYVSQKQAYRVLADWFEGKIDIPYRRTGAYGRSWRILRHGQEGWRMFSTSPYAQFVAGGPMGEPQFRMHRDVWAHFRSELDYELNDLPITMRKHFATVARGLGFSWKEGSIEGFRIS